MDTSVQKKILVIDDNLTDLKLITSLLESGGYSILAMGDAALGLEKAIAVKPDLLVLDVMMPIINGYNICRLLKNHSECCKIPILLVTSRSTNADRKIGEEAGANSYMAKPFNGEMLLKKVQQLLG